MKTHSLIQGTEPWSQYRATHNNASDAPAMMGVSPYKTRSELIHERATGLSKEVDAGTQRRFDDGHRFEALARPLAEEIIGDDLYPVVGSDGELSASFDGITMCHSVIFEHKSLNDEIRAAATVADLGLHYRVQMEQQLIVSGAAKCLFLATRWSDDDTLLEQKHFWYEEDAALRAQIIAGWTQFAIDVAAYVPRETSVAPAADAIIALPALIANIRGEVVTTNLPVFKAAAEKFIANIKTDLQTDEDFVNAEATVRFCDSAEKNLERAKSAAIAQTASIDDLMRTVDHIKEQLRTKRLALEKLVKTKKDQIKETILSEARSAWITHVKTLDAEIAPLRLPLAQPDFAGAMKNKRTIASLHDSVDTLLAVEKIAANETAADVRAKSAWHATAAAGHETLFADLQQLIAKPMEDFQLAVNARITEHKRVEAEKVAAAAILAQQEAAKEIVVPAVGIRTIIKGSGGILTGERERLQACAEQHLVDSAESAADERKCGLPAGALRDLADHLDDIGLFPDDSEIVDEIRAMFMTQWDMDETQADARMSRFVWPDAVVAV